MSKRLLPFKGTEWPEHDPLYDAGPEISEEDRQPLTAAVELGDYEGHPFRGNQYTDVLSDDATYERGTEHARALAEKTFTGKFGKFDVVSRTMLTNKTANKGLSQIVDIKLDGKTVGNAKFSVDAERHEMHVDLMTLLPEVQGGGFAAEYMDHVEQVAADHGIDRISLEANISVGGYAWAKQGYEFADPLEARQIVDSVRRFDPGLAEVFKDIDLKTATPLDIAMAGREQYSGRDENGRQSWPGKELMLGREWQGVKDISWRRDLALAAAATPAAAVIGPAYLASIRRAPKDTPLLPPPPSHAGESDYNLHHLTVDIEDPEYWAAVQAITASVDGGWQPPWEENDEVRPDP